MYSILIGGLGQALGAFAASDIEKSVSDLSVSVVVAAALFLMVLIVTATLTHERWPQLKLPLFVLIAIVVVSTTLTISGATVYLNVKSATGGPVHWHADYQVWACGNQLNLRDPSGILNNKIGTPTLHEHNDGRIHLEGTLVALPYDASLGKFLSVVGGGITDDSLVFPLNDDGNYFTGQPNSPELLKAFIATNKSGAYARFVSGESCAQARAQVQVFAYHYDEASKTYTQRKIEHPANYELSHTSNAPPGDCIIVEFSPAKDHTNHLCKQYQLSGGQPQGTD